MTIHVGMRDLLISERGAFCLLLLAMMTVFFCLGMLSSDQYLDFVKWAVTVLLVSKTVEIATRKPEVPISGKEDTGA
jgi:hypothetical protein